eukprot:scaffold112073_cov64-Phaeocystis_antarctica.AAC.2
MRPCAPPTMPGPAAAAASLGGSRVVWIETLSRSGCWRASSSSCDAKRRSVWLRAAKSSAAREWALVRKHQARSMLYSGLMPTPPATNSAASASCSTSLPPTWMATRSPTLAELVHHAAGGCAEALTARSSSGSSLGSDAIE